MDISSIALVTTGSSVGTAFMISDHLLITSLHVVQNQSDINIQLLDNKGIISKSKIHASVFHVVPDLDIAILEIDSKTEALNNLSVSIAPFPEVQGHYFEMCGFPQETEYCLTKLDGWLSIRRTVNKEDRQIPAFQLNPLNKTIKTRGSSGSPVYVPFLGGIVGVYAGYHNITGIHFAVPIVDILESVPSKIRSSLNIKMLPHLEKTGLAKTYSPSTFYPILDASIWETALKSSRQSLLALLGPSGIGKSSHASFWVDQARTDGHMVLWADVSEDLGLGNTGTLSITDCFFKALAINQSQTSRVTLDIFLQQLTLANEKYHILMNLPYRRIVAVIDGIDALEINKRKALKDRLINDLDFLGDRNLPATFLCCERSEFTEVEGFRYTTSSKIVVENLCLTPLSRDDTIRVYEKGYRDTKYSWLPRAEDLPSDLLDLCRIPLFITFVIRTIVRLETNQPATAGLVLREFISDIIDRTYDELTLCERNAILKKALQNVIRESLLFICRESALSTPPCGRAEVQKVLKEIKQILTARQIDKGLVRPQSILSALSRIGCLNVSDNYVSIIPDVLYEYLVCEIYAELASDKNENQEEIDKRIQDIAEAVHGHSIEILTPQSLNQLIEWLLMFPPSREIASLRFWGPVVAPRYDWGILEFGFDLRLIQMVREFCDKLEKQDLEQDEKIYHEVQKKMPTLLPEGILAMPPYISTKKDDSKEIIIGFEDGESCYDFLDSGSWIRMRRALYLLFVLNEHRLTVLQNIISSINFYKVDEFSKRLILLANSILERHPTKAIQAYLEGQTEGVIFLLLYIQMTQAKMRNKKVSDQWPEWLQSVSLSLLFHVITQVRFKGNKTLYAPTIFFISLLNNMPKETVQVLSVLLQKSDKNVRINCLKACKFATDLVEKNTPENILRGIFESGVLFKVFTQFAPLLHEELTVHAQRKKILKEERELALSVVNRLWDGTRPGDELPDDPETRPRVIETTIKMNYQIQNISLIDTINSIKNDIQKSADDIQRALDAIVVCLTVISLYPAEWKVAWKAMSDFILYIEPIGELTDILNVATKQKESKPGERYEAVNLLLLPLFEESSFSEDVRRRTILVERWAKSRPRFLGEKNYYDALTQAHEFLKRKDYLAAQQFAQTIISETPGPMLSAQAYLILVHAYQGINDDVATFKVIKKLENYIKRTVDKDFYDLLVQNKVLGKYAERIQKCQRDQLRSILWPAREIRAEINQKKKNRESYLFALSDLRMNRQEAMELEAWWPAFKGMEKECELYRLIGKHSQALNAAKELEQASNDPVPRMFGRMQRAVVLFDIGNIKRNNSIVEKALAMLNEIEPNIDDLINSLPQKEVYGIRLWVGSIRGWCLNYIHRFDEAIDVAKEVLDLAQKVESKRDISLALALLQNCQENTGILGDAIDSAKKRYILCKTDSVMKKDAAEAAADIGRLFEKEPLSLETAKLAQSWYKKAIELYQELEEKKLVADIQKKIAILDNEFGLM